MKRQYLSRLTTYSLIYRKRILLVALLAVSIVSMMATTSPGPATAHSAAAGSPPTTAVTGFAITSPVQGSLVPCGQPITVTWTGGSPSDMVAVVLIDVQSFTVVQGFGVVPNTGSQVVTIGLGSCGRISQFYVEDSPRTTWTYGPAFTVGPASPSCTTPPANMISWWPGDGNARDIQDGNDGAPAGGATFAPGKVGQAFSFDGINDFVDIQPNANLDLRQTLTIDAWVNPTNINGDRGIVEKTVGGGVNSQYSLFLSNGQVIFRLIKVPGVDHRTIGSSSMVPINSWTHVAATWDGVTMKLFVNGIQQGGGLGVAPPLNGGEGPTLIGKQGSGINPFSGLIDEVEIFNRALTSQEILAIYQAGSGGKCKPDVDGDGLSDAIDNCIRVVNPDQADADNDGVGDACEVPLTCVEPPSNMVSWWPGDGDTNDIQDGNNGTLQNGATFGPGKVAQAFSFGTNSFVNVPYNSNLDLRQTLTIDAWINPSVITGDRGIVEKTVGGGVNTQYSLFLQSGFAVFRLIKVPGVDHRTIGSDSLIPTNTWTHIAATWDGATMKLFVNGFQQANTAGVTGSINGGVGPTLFGRQGSGINAFSGLIDEVEIFNRALSREEIRAIYLADTAGKCKTPADSTPPLITCPAPFEVPSNSECMAEVPDVTSLATATDDSGSVTLSQSPAPGTLVGLGNTTITVTATDAANNSSSCSVELTVVDNTPPTIAPMTNITTTTDPGACTATVNYAPAVSDNCGEVSFGCSSPSGSAFPIGTTGVTCTAIDASGNTASTSFTVTVDNPAPTVSINSPASGAIFAVGTNVNFAGNFSDNAGDLHTAQWNFVSSNQNISQSGTVNEGASTVDASYSFTTPGVYLVTLTVADQCGHSATANVVDPDGLPAMVVVYDPNGGSVTGGGWFDSPAGALVANPSLIGRANFGFTSRYHSGTNVPDGQTEFQFKAGNLNFHSSSYEWLVVAGAKAQFKGSGTINGSGAYDFMLTVIDGQISGGGGVDKFRIRIWDSNGGGLVYDNKVGGAVNDDPTTVIRGGSIVIHK